MKVTSIVGPLFLLGMCFPSSILSRGHGPQCLYFMLGLAPPLDRGGKNPRHVPLMNPNIGIYMAKTVWMLKNHITRAPRRSKPLDGEYEHVNGHGKKSRTWYKPDDSGRWRVQENDFIPCIGSRETNHLGGREMEPRNWSRNTTKSPI